MHVRLIAALAALAAACCANGGAALGTPLVASRASKRTVTLRVAVRGYGSVRMGTLVCRSRCTWRFARGSIRHLYARASLGNRFLRWRGKCASRRPACTLRLGNSGTLDGSFAPITTLTSWSTHVRCKPVRTTIPEIVGAQEGPGHGATEAGGRFQPHLRGAAQQHLTQRRRRAGARLFGVGLERLAQARRCSVSGRE